MVLIVVSCFYEEVLVLLCHCEPSPSAVWEKRGKFRYFGGTSGELQFLNIRTSRRQETVVENKQMCFSRRQSSSQSPNSSEALWNGRNENQIPVFSDLKQSIIVWFDERRTNGKEVAISDGCIKPLLKLLMRGRKQSTLFALTTSHRVGSCCSLEARCRYSGTAYTQVSLKGGDQETSSLENSTDRKLHHDHHNVVFRRCSFLTANHISDVSGNAQR